MKDISDRLASARARQDLSLRAFAKALEERVGHRVSFDSVRRYEAGDTVPPADYLAAVCRAFDVDPAWMLLGTGSMRRIAPAAQTDALEQIATIVDTLRAGGPARAAVEAVERAWKRFTAGMDSEIAVRPVILESWGRSRESEVTPKAGELEPRRVGAEELDRRVAAAGPLVEAADPYLEWIARMLGSARYVVYVVCREGIVVRSTAASEALAESWSLLPGYDWSEEAMGTNGAGTALATGRPVAVIGPEHYNEGFHDCTCLAAPLREPGGELAGALDVSLEAGRGTPELMALVCYCAWGIERKLAEATA